MSIDVGDRVVYMSHGSPVLSDGTQKYKPEPRAAIVTAVPEWPGLAPRRLSLCVLNPTGMFFDLDVPYSGGREGGTWHERDRSGMVYD